MRVHLVGQSVNHAVEKTFCPIFSQRLSPLSPLGHKKNASDNLVKPKRKQSPIFEITSLFPVSPSNKTTPN